MQQGEGAARLLSTAPTWDRGRGSRPTPHGLCSFLPEVHAGWGLREKPQEAPLGTRQKHLLASLATTDIAADWLQDRMKIKGQPTHTGAGTQLARGRQDGRDCARRLCAGVQGGAAECPPTPRRCRCMCAQPTWALLQGQRAHSGRRPPVQPGPSQCASRHGSLEGLRDSTLT